MDFTKIITFAFNLKTWLWVGLAVILALGGIVGTSYVFGLGKGKLAGEQALSKLKEEVAARDKKQLQDLADANDRNRQQELDHEKYVANLRAGWAASQAAEHASDVRIINDLSSGNKRLRIAITACTNASTQANTPITATTGIDGSGSADIAPKAAAILWSIAADGDRAARKLTALQDWARAAVKLCNNQE
jgi:hypothetical protein